MKCTLTHVLLYWLLFCFSNSLIAQVAGSMPNDTLFICDYSGTLRVENNNNDSLRMGDALNYIIESGTDENNFFVSIDGFFLWEELIDTLDFSTNYCDEFFIYAVAGEADTSGYVINIDVGASKTNKQLLVTFGLGVPIDESPSSESEITLEVGNGEILISSPCEEEGDSAGTSCNYNFPSVGEGSSKLVSIDTIFPTWYVIEEDSTALRVQGDTIFRHILNPTNPDTSNGIVHIDTIIITPIEDQNTSIRLQNANNLIAASSFYLDFQHFNVIYNFRIDEGEAEETCGITSGIQCSNGGILVNIIYPSDCSPPVSIGFDTIPLLCEEELIELSAREIEGATYSWNTGDTARSIMVSTGYYEVTITKGNCVLFIQSDNIQPGAAPAYSSIKKSCNSEDATYQVKLRLYQSTIDVNSISRGRLEQGVDNYSVSIVDIPITEILYFSLKHEISKCRMEYMVVPPPDCVSPIGLRACTEKDSIVAIPNDPSSMTIDWYASPTGDDLLKEGQFDFSPLVRGIYYAQARYFESGFVVEERTPVVFGVDAPTLNIIREKVSHCEQAEGEIDLELEGSYPPYEVIWENNIITNNRTQLGVDYYPITIKDSLECLYLDTIQIKNDPDLCDEIYIPSTFSPNGDNQNDTFKIGLPYDFAKVIQVKIFDQHGRFLFESQDNMPGNGILLDAWDGTFRGKPLGQGIYMYVVEITRPAGRRIILEGEVNLVR